MSSSCAWPLATSMAKSVCTGELAWVRRKRTVFSSGVIFAPTGRPAMKRRVVANWRRKAVGLLHGHGGGGGLRGEGGDGGAQGEERGEQSTHGGGRPFRGGAPSRQPSVRDAEPTLGPRARPGKSARGEVIPGHGRIAPSTCGSPASSASAWAGDAGPGPRTPTSSTRTGSPCPPGPARWGAGPPALLVTLDRHLDSRGAPRTPRPCRTGARACAPWTSTRAGAWTCATTITCSRPWRPGVRRGRTGARAQPAPRHLQPGTRTRTRAGARTGW